MVTQTPKALCYSPSRDLGGIFTQKFWNYCRNKLLKMSFLCCVIFTQFRWFAVDFYAFNCCLLMTKLRHALENDKITAVILTTWKYLFIPPPPNLQIIPSILLKFDFKSCLFDFSLGGGRGEYKCSFSHVGWMTCTEL